MFSQKILDTQIEQAVTCKCKKILNYLILLLQNAISWQLTALLPRIETLANYAGGDFLQILCEQCLVSMCNEETAQGNLKMGQRVTL